ncbi:MAG: hypothetical protein ACREA4_01970 [Nitrososphaera sp.]
MSTYGISGSSPFADLTKTIEALLRDLLFAQWSLSSPAKDTDPEKAASTRIRFGLGWGGTGVRNNFEIHCLHLSTLKEVAANGWRLHAFKTIVDVHVFVRRTTTAEPDSLRKMLQEIDRIVTQKRLNLGEGVKPMRLINWQQADDPDDTETASYWHRVGQVEAWYWKTDTS